MNRRGAIVAVFLAAAALVAGYGSATVIERERSDQVVMDKIQNDVRSLAALRTAVRMLECGPLHKRQ